MADITFKHTLKNVKIKYCYNASQQNSIKLNAWLDSSAIPEIKKSLNLDSSQYEIVFNSLDRYHLIKDINNEYKIFVKESIILQPKQIWHNSKPGYCWLDSGDYFAGELVHSELTYTATCNIKISNISQRRRGRTTIDKILINWDNIKIDEILEIGVESVDYIVGDILTK